MGKFKKIYTIEETKSELHKVSDNIKNMMHKYKVGNNSTDITAFFVIQKKEGLARRKNYVFKKGTSTIIKAMDTDATKFLKMLITKAYFNSIIQQKYMDEIIKSKEAVKCPKK